MLLRNININICSNEIKWDVNKLNYKSITRWDEYEWQCEMEVICSTQKSWTN